MSLSLESAISLVSSAGDKAESAPVVESYGWRKRDLEISRWSDTVDASMVLVETITYPHPIESPGCGAVSARSTVWVAR